MKYLIFGAGLFGRSLAKRLSALGAEVHVVDHNESAIEDVKDFVASAVVGESTERETVEHLVEKINPDVCAVCFGENFDATLLAVIYLNNVGVKHIVARASNELQKEILEKLGVERIVLPEVMMGERTGEHIILGESEFLPLDPENAVARVHVPEKIQPHLIDQLPLKKFGLTLLFVHRFYIKDKISKIIHAEQVEQILPRDNIIILGNPKKISEFVKYLYALPQEQK